jgi:endonuclease/exonuclease/phosphatase family metal-dependent hydrolase
MMIRRFALLLSLSSLPLGAEPVQEIRVMSWNLHHGVGEDDKLDLERIAARIKEQKPDLVVLQEVDNKCRRSKSVDQAAELAKLTGLTGVFGKAMDFDGGEYGQAILSKHPLGETKIHRLPGDGEPRIAFEAVVNFKSQPVRLVSVHLDHQQDARRLKQAETLVKELSASKEPLILAGDFNDVPDSPVLKAFAEGLTPVKKGADHLTCPAAKPDAEIDHMFVRGLKAESPVTVLPEAVASDHRPVVMTVQLGKGS